MLQRIKTYFRKKMTFMVVPHDGGLPIQIKTNLFILHSAILLLGGLVVWAAILMIKDVNYELASLNDQKMRTQVVSAMTELERNKVLLSHMAEVDQQFRKLLKLGDRKEVMLYNGVEGNKETDTDLLFQAPDQELLGKLRTDLQETGTVAAKQEASFEEVSAYLNKERSILAATPSIWPIKGWITSGFGKRSSPLTGEPGRQ